MQLFDFKFDKGSVWLVGAGPGDPGLLTLLAYKSIKKADVIFYDALLDDHILSIAKPKAELVFVGKRGNKKSINQLEINHLLINEAKTDVATEVPHRNTGINVLAKLLQNIIPTIEKEYKLTKISDSIKKTALGFQ